ncbi:hypothetical protein TrVE_jg214 [Triparma verrucosa]|uniref:Uncharacterized protein n=2 Tax=Triparma TaxID=722752 RepID=A0A9W7BZ46_9STRA|nr:hypothetical protein TrVE_jg214 [Triparma verrucosa]GMH99569.1 hypothetical protein TrST_g3294 [Triparma strigata]
MATTRSGARPRSKSRSRSKSKSSPLNLNNLNTTLKQTLESIPPLDDIAQNILNDVIHLDSHLPPKTANAINKLFLGELPDQKSRPSEFLPLFHSLLIMSLTSGMVSAILIVDLIFDFPCALHQVLGLESRANNAFIYYSSILNSPVMTFKTLGAMNSVLYGSWLALTTGSKLTDPKFERKFPLNRRFQIIFGIYVCMTLIYLAFIIPRYLPFMQTYRNVFLGGSPVAFMEEDFENWWVITVLRLVLFTGNIVAVVMCIQCMRKLVRCIE